MKLLYRRLFLVCETMRYTRNCIKREHKRYDKKIEDNNWYVW
jgi:hypothetical protein